MRLQILHVAGCPNVAVLQARLADLVGGRADVEISRQLVEDGEQAADARDGPSELDSPSERV